MKCNIVPRNQFSILFSPTLIDCQDCGNVLHLDGLLRPIIQIISITEIMQDVCLLSTVHMGTAFQVLPHRTQNMEVNSGQHSGDL